MAFTSTLTERTVMGNKRVNYGTFGQGNGDTGGNVVTGLKSVEAFFLNGAGSWTASGGTVTATTADPGATIVGSWMAIGY